MSVWRQRHQRMTLSVVRVRTFLFVSGCGSGVACATRTEISCTLRTHTCHLCLILDSIYTRHARNVISHTTTTTSIRFEFVFVCTCTEVYIHVNGLCLLNLNASHFIYASSVYHSSLISLFDSCLFCFRSRLCLRLYTSFVRTHVRLRCSVLMCGCTSHHFCSD